MSEVQLNRNYGTKTPDSRSIQRRSVGLQTARAGTVAVVVLLLAGAASTAWAAVAASEFPPRTVRDLIALCSADKSDPMLVAAVNYCHAYTEAAVDVEIAHANQKHGRKLFCLPSPLPPRGAVLASFVDWANAQPMRLDRPAIDGLFLYLAEAFPCGKRN